MAKRENWAHYTRNILDCNRLLHTEPVLEDPDADIEEEKKKIEAKDPYETRLKSIAQDEAVKGGFPAWTVRSHGDKMTYANANPAYPTKNFGIVVVKSLVWPGAFNFFTEGQWS